MGSGKVLVVKRSKEVNNPGQWNFPGGSSTKRKPKSLVKKEALEEVGVEVEKVKLILEVDTVSKRHHFYIMYLPCKVGVTLNYESTEYRWVKINRLRKFKGKHKSVKLFLKYFGHE